MALKTCALFLNHGSPMMALEDNVYTKRLRQFGEQLRPQLKGVVLFSAHHYERGISIGGGDREYPLINDFYGFPDELYHVKYAARSSVEIADKVKARFTAAGIKCTLDTKRGLDHGSWTMLKHLFPRGDVPVTDVSVVPSLPPREQIRIGEALRGLNKEGILVIGSGATVHNFDEDYSDASWGQEFDDWLVARTVGRVPDLELLTRYAELAPNARRAFRTNEHFVPFLIAAGAAPPGAMGAILDRTPMEAFGYHIPALSVRYDEP